MINNKIAFIIATRERPREIRKLLGNLVEQTRIPDEIIIVDSSANEDADIKDEFQGLNIIYLHHLIASASAQRNAGVRLVSKDIDLIGFLDDDVVLEENALESMMGFWENADKDIGGCGFNIRSFEPTGFGRMKSSGLSKKLGLYSGEKGLVMPSGWATMIGEVEENIFVQWLPTLASVWRKEILGKYSFEEKFTEYSYLEDLDFSYGVSRMYRLAVLAKAGVFHYHSPAGRIGSYKFGKIEVANRLFLVKKHGLSFGSCYLAIFIRLFMTVGAAVKGMDKNLLLRALGNIKALLKRF